MTQCFNSLKGMILMLFTFFFRSRDRLPSTSDNHKGGGKSPTEDGKKVNKHHINVSFDLTLIKL